MNTDRIDSAGYLLCYIVGSLLSNLLDNPVGGLLNNLLDKRGVKLYSMSF